MPIPTVAGCFVLSVDAATIRRARQAHGLVDLIAGDVVLKRRGGAYVGLCPFHREKTPSFSIVPAKGFWHCFGCGEHGDAIDWVVRVEGVSFVEALDRLAEGRVSVRPPAMPIEVTPPDAPTAVQDNRLRARAYWAGARHTTGTPAETYLRGRGIIGPIPPTIRYCENLPSPYGRMPALIAALSNGGRQVVGIWRIYLRASGPRGWIKASETALAIKSALGPTSPVWSCLSTSGIRSVIIPGTVREVIVAPDHDEQKRGRDGKWRQPGVDAARALVARLDGSGIRVRLADPGRGQDFNDLLRHG